MPCSGILQVHLLLSNCWQGYRRSGGIIHCRSGDEQFDSVATLPQHLSNLLTAQTVQVSVPDTQDVITTAQATILQDRVRKERERERF